MRPSVPSLRIILSACADEEDLIGSINQSEVYRYYAKPWDAAALRDGLRDAFRHYWRQHDAPTRPTGPSRGRHLLTLSA